MGQAFLKVRVTSQTHNQGAGFISRLKSLLDSMSRRSSNKNENGNATLTYVVSSFATSIIPNTKPRVSKIVSS